MSIAGKLGRLLVVQASVSVVLVLVVRDDRPAAAWVLGFLAFVGATTGVVLWAHDELDRKARSRAEWTARHHRRARSESREEPWELR